MASDAAWQATLREIADYAKRRLRETTGEDVAFICLGCRFGDEGGDGRLHYASNIEREDALTSMSEFLLHQRPELLQEVVRRIQAQQIHGPERTH